MSEMPAITGQRAAAPTDVLVLDVDSQAAQCLVKTLAQRGIRAHVVMETQTALDYVDRHPCALAFVGLGFVFRDGAIDFDLLRLFRVGQPELPLVLLASVEELHAGRTPDAQPATDELLRRATEVMRHVALVGRCNCVIKPLNGDDIADILDKHLPNRPVAQMAVADESGQVGFRIVGKSASMGQVIELAERIAPTSAPVLISGESGSGKELIAALIHHRSHRALGPYIKVNCAALNDSLLESELFGHEKGAFTGAFAQRKGRFEQAHGGTLLLDEITETPPQFQAKLLRIIEEQAFERVGGNENLRVNVRIISTTNRDLLGEVQRGGFRQDLYYRLAATRLVVPPLRQRQEDLADLVWHFVNLYACESQRPIDQLDPVMMELFAKYAWPGNIRQLRNVVRTSLILGLGSTLSLADVSWLFDGVPEPSRIPLPDESDAAASLTSAVAPLSLSRAEPAGLGGVALEELERRAILDTLKQTAGNRKRAAEVLGISDRTLRERIRRYKEQVCLSPV